MEQTLSRQNQRQHIVWLDVVRLVAMFTVVCCHSADPFNFYPGTSPDIANIKFWGAIYGAILRPCVPLFVMNDYGSFTLARTWRCLRVL